MATPQEEQARRDALDKRREEGANAWSPSRAREALRAWLRGRGSMGSGYNECFKILNRAESGVNQAFDSRETFDGFCMMELEELLDV